MSIPPNLQNNQSSVNGSEKRSDAVGDGMSNRVSENVSEKVLEKTLCLLEEITFALDRGQFPTARTLLAEVDDIPILSRECVLRVQLAKVRLYCYEEKFNEGLKLADEAYLQALEIAQYQIAIQIGVKLADIHSRMGKVQISQDLLDDLNILNDAHFSQDTEIHSKLKSDILFMVSANQWHTGQLQDSLNTILECIELRRKYASEVALANAIAFEGMIYCELGQIPKGISFLKEALVCQKKLNNLHYLSILFNNLGWVFRLKGDLIKAQRYLQESVKIRKEIGNILNCRIEFANLGVIEHQMGNLAQAEKHLFEALELGKKVGNPVEIAVFLFYLIRLLLDQNKTAEAKKNIDTLQELSELTGNEKISQRYLLSYALYLMKNPRVKNLYRAQNMFREIAQKAIVKHELTVEALIHLCDLLIFELKISNDPEIMEEINDILAKLLNIAKEIRSYYLWCEINFLRAKLALMNLDVLKARKLFSQAQIIAQEQGLQQLAIRISNEHDQLLEQEKIWEQFQAAPPDYYKRTELARINDNIQRIKRQGIVESVYVEPEEPVMFVIMNETGPNLYTHAFTAGLNFNEQLFGGILSAFEAFSTEIFKGVLERAKFGDYKVLVKTISPFLVCYIYKGPSYFAQENFIKSLDMIQNQREIWEILIDATKNGNLISSHRIPELTKELEKIFHNSKRF
ncbi:MAG: tetratricopeptide repeat protein [Promethearchaeota archaeon]